MEKRDELMKIFSEAIRNVLGRLDVDFEDIQKIRLGALVPLLVIYKSTEYYLTCNGRLSRKAEDAYVVSRKEVREIAEYVSHCSLYVYEEEMRQGFIAIQGGHQIGVAGETTVDDERIRSMEYMSFINTRLSRQVRGCTSAVLSYLHHDGDIFHTLVILPPRCGKTTLLQGVIHRILNSTGKGPRITVGVINERLEIGACYQGAPQNKLGIRTDIPDCCPRAKGMMMLIWIMSPRVITVGEIGSREDLETTEYVMNCGYKLVAMVHNNFVEDVKQKPVLRELVQERVSERHIALDNKGKIGHVARIYDSKGTRLYHPEDCL